MQGTVEMALWVKDLSCEHSYKNAEGFLGLAACQLSQTSNRKNAVREEGCEITVRSIYSISVGYGAMAGIMYA